MNVTVQVLAFDEPEKKLRATFESVHWQALGDGLAYTPEAWITPAYPGDHSFQVAADCDFRVYRAGEGKITARNQAHDHAVSDGADVIVSMDADAPFLHEHALSALVEPLRAGEAVATNSMPVAHAHPTDGTSPLGMGIDMAGRIEDVLFPHMHGQCSAFTAQAWRDAGPFDTDRDETDSAEVRAEEEIAFYGRLRDVGHVEYVKSAKVYNDPRRHYCKFFPPLAPDGYCEARGERTFGEEYGEDSAESTARGRSARNS